MSSLKNSPRDPSVLETDLAALENAARELAGECPDALTHETPLQGIEAAHRLAALRSVQSSRSATLKTLQERN